MAEAIAVLKAAFSSETFSFTGQHYQVRGHAAGRVPAQRPHPPLMIGAVGPPDRPHGSGLILSSVSAQATGRKLGWVR